ncbi:MAG: ATP-dependent RNA helicase RhlE [Rickettsiales bacterium TMED269]|nr:ATP-dependent RNA helicase RhlE [Gammaproteobacteria bacterium]OUX39463.1 MAG: ATP-dependent RNA helicase RhlE [Rickettsiales bacterium TMED269]|tara:strand:- start:429 stop:1778 length:1350 start_codon:yes stop_codon:yes gene_type:complete
MSFKNLGLSDELLNTIQKEGYSEATPVQERAIPLINKGMDILAGAQTGTGKTAAFALPILNRLQKFNSKKRKVRALILTPTRELAAQVNNSFRTYGIALPFKTIEIFGGVSMRPQKSKLKKGVDIVVATPGRLLDHLSQNTIDLSGVEVFVLDEADRMLDMGFKRDIEKVIKQLPERRQNLLFSATFPKEIQKLASRLLNSPKKIQVASENSTAEKVKQTVYPVDQSRKRELLIHSIKENNWFQVLVFIKTKRAADKLTRQLNKKGILSDTIHGNKTQAARSKALEGFKKGKVQVLVATDVAARGIDIDLLPVVINFNLPMVAEDYIHRIGRTARAGKEGEAISLVCAEEFNLLSDIERLLKFRIPREDIEGFETTQHLNTTNLKPKNNQHKKSNYQGFKKRKRSDNKKPHWHKKRKSSKKKENNKDRNKKNGPAKSKRSFNKNKFKKK